VVVVLVMLVVAKEDEDVNEDDDEDVDEDDDEDVDEDVDEDDDEDVDDDDDEDVDNDDEDVDDDLDEDVDEVVVRIPPDNIPQVAPRLPVLLKASTILVVPLTATSKCVVNRCATSMV
jgi:hypothetical protein